MRRAISVSLVVTMVALAFVGPAAPANAAQTPAEAMTAGVQSAAAQGVTQFVSAMDRQTGAVVAQTGNAGAQVASESIMKLFIATYYLLLYGGHAATPQSVKDRLAYMLIYSDDATASSYFTASAIPTVAARYGLPATTNATDRPGHWGAARITAADVTRFLYLASKDDAVGPWLMPVMSQTAPTGSGQDAGFNQYFGLNALGGVHGSKQGWGCDSFWTIPDCAVHSVGYTDRYFVSVLQLSGGYPDPMRTTATVTARLIQASLWGNPIGNLESVTVSGQSVRLQGWTIDPDATSVEIPVAVAADGPVISWYETGIPRPDVNQAYGIAGDHGFDITVRQPPGPHTMRVYAINTGPGWDNPLLGTAAINSGFLPRGNVDAVSVGPSGTVRLGGWSYDADEPATSIPVAVYVDGQGVSWFPTDRPRGDVNQAFGITGTHGFDITFAAPPGRHTVTVFAINAGGGIGNPVVGQAAVDVGTAVGHLDSVARAGPGQVRMRGWAVDPDDPAAAIKVAAYRDDAGISWFPTGQARPDVNQALGIGGDHGFDITVPSPTGMHRFTSYAINIGAPNINPWIGTLTLQVN